MRSRPRHDFSYEPGVDSEARWRNSMQDVALAQMALKARPAIKDDLVKTLGSCTAPPFHEREQYLPIRDYLFRLP